MVRLSKLIIFLFITANSFAGTWMMGAGKGSHGSEVPVVTHVGSNSANSSPSATSISTSAGINVNAGDVIIVWGGNGSNNDLNASSSPSVGTFTEVSDVWDSSNTYKTAWYRLVATSTQSNVIFTISSAPSTGSFWGIGASVFRTSSGTFTFDSATCGTAGCGLLNSTSANRTASNLTSAVANSLLVGFGIDWDGTTHTGANGFAVSLDGTTNFSTWKQVSSTGSYPGGNFSTVSPTDEYFSYFACFSISP